ncbi:hypothetical protein [Roseateles sp.]|uniref:hypothetical protein n=1 Tax=Roseateles sp. TaxID=1971397 RepID=UPI002F3EFCE8
MLELQVGPEWTQKISRLRDALTDDTNFIRRDNSFFRLCRDNTRSVDIVLKTSPLNPGTSLRLNIQERDLYIHYMEGQLVFKDGQYPKGVLETLNPTMASLDLAIQLVKQDPVGQMAQRTLIAFCVAESLRSDTVAMSIDFMMKQSTSTVRGLNPSSEMIRLVRFARHWGKSSDEIRGALSEKGREIALKPQARLSAEERRYSERVAWHRIDAGLADVAGGVKALKLPKSDRTRKA